MASLDFSTRKDLPISCGTVVLQPAGTILLCHVTGHDLWDLPKGMQEPDETAVKTAQRELHEETGLEFAEQLFVEIGCFDFRPDKRLHLFKLRVPESATDLTKMHCASHFLDTATGTLLPEMDGFCCGSRDDVAALCGPNMQRVLLSIDW